MLILLLKLLKPKKRSASNSSSFFTANHASSSSRKGSRRNFVRNFLNPWTFFWPLSLASTLGFHPNLLEIFSNGNIRNYFVLIFQLKIISASRLSTRKRKFDPEKKKVDLTFFPRILLSKDPQTPLHCQFINLFYFSSTFGINFVSASISPGAWIYSSDAGLRGDSQVRAAAPKLSPALTALLLVGVYRTNHLNWPLCFVWNPISFIPTFEKDGGFGETRFCLNASSLVIGSPVHS